MKQSEAYTPRKMRDNNRPTKTTEPNPDPSKRGPRPPADRLRIGGAVAPVYKIAAEVNKQGQLESSAKREEFARRAQESCDPLKAAYWQQRAQQVLT